MRIFGLEGFFEFRPLNYGPKLFGHRNAADVDTVTIFAWTSHIQRQALYPRSVPPEATTRLT